MTAPPASGLKTQALRFLVTGGFSAVVDFGLVQLLAQAGVPVQLANIAGFVVGTTVAYLINRRWTFEAAPSAKRLLQVAALYTVAFGLRVGIFKGLYAVLPAFGVQQEQLRISIAWVIAQGTVTVMNFLVQRLVIFKAAEPQGEGVAEG